MQGTTQLAKEQSLESEFQMEEKAPKPRPSFARWQILRRALLPPKQAEKYKEMFVQNISRKPVHGFNMIPYDVHDGHSVEDSRDMKYGWDSKEACICYSLPKGIPCKLALFQRTENHINLNDFEICNSHNIDNTGLVCSWPSEDVLAHFSLSNAEMFRSKKVLELGAGYGLAGFAIAAGTNAYEMVISDGNPQVVDYYSDITRNISVNAGAFGGTKVKSMLIHWNHEPDSNLLNYFDIIVVSDCTFFKEFHECLALTIKSLLRQSETSEAILLNPRRGDSLEMFLQKLDIIGLKYKLFENYDHEVWSRHLEFISGTDMSWPNYNMDHCYPLLLRITL